MKNTRQCSTCSLWRGLRQGYARGKCTHASRVNRGFGSQTSSDFRCSHYTRPRDPKTETVAQMRARRMREVLRLNRELRALLRDAENSLREMAAYIGSAK